LKSETVLMNAPAKYDPMLE